jgi:hypothetical protein
MYGTIVLNHRAGRGLRRQKVAVTAANVLWCMGRFRAGDPVYLGFCGLDGGQFVIAKGVSLLGDAELREKLPATSAKGGATATAADHTLVVAETDVELIW